MLCSCFKAPPKLKQNEMSFSESSLSKKLAELNNTQQSVQTLSLWLIHHRKHSKVIVKNWYKELMSATKCERKITFIYLANDILQNSRKKGAEYMTEFLPVLNDAIENTAKYSDEKVRFTLERILNIWKDRKIFADEELEKMRKTLHETKQIDQLNSPPLTTDSPANSGTSKPKKQPSSDKYRLSKSSSEGSAKDAEDSNRKRKLAPSDPSNGNHKNGADHEAPSAKLLTQSSITVTSKQPSLREEIAKELAATGATLQPPDASDLIAMLQDLEKSASSDAVVREKIADLPPRVNDINALKNLRDKNEAIELSNTVNEAISLLDNYNSRLQQELTSRRKTALLFAAFIRQQQLEIENDQKLIEEWQRKLKQVKNIKNELHTHLESLPDLTTIEEAAEMTPLPSAGDLFAASAAQAATASSS